MPISSTDNRWPFTGDGATTTFFYTNKIFAATDLKVFLDNVQQVGGFTVTGVGAETGGSVVFDTAPAVGVKGVILREVPFDQLIDFIFGGKFPSQNTEDGLDKSAVLVQQLLDRITRAVRLSDSDPTTGFGVLPPLDQNIGKYFSVGADSQIALVDGTAESADLSDKTVLPVGASVAERIDVLFGKTPFTTDANTFDKLQTFTLGATLNGLLTIAKAFARTGIIRPPQLVGNVDDWNPTGLADASIVILDASTSVNISGLAGGAVGRVITFHNISGSAITFLDQSSSSLAVNRFQTNGGLVLGSADSLSFFYDDNISRWRPLSRSWQFGGSSTQEAGTSTTLLVVPARQHRHPSACKAWINFNGTGTIAIREEYNVFSITDNGVGDYTVTWDVNFSNTNYCVVGAAAIADPPGTETTLLPHSYLTGSVGIRCREGGAALQDNLFVNVAAFGDQ